ETRAEIARELRQRAVGSVLARRQPPPEAAHGGPMMRAGRAHHAGDILAGDLAHEVEMGEIALDDMRIGVDHGMVEPGAHVATGKSLETRHGRSSLAPRGAFGKA